MTSIWQDQEAIQSLTEHGFYPQQAADGSLKLYCSDGEVDIRTKDGVRYTLWFGSQTPTVDSKGESRLNRYVMISAAVEPTAFEKPELQLPPEATSSPLPQTSEESANALDTAVQAPEVPVAPAESEPEATEPAADQETPAIDTERDRVD